MDRVDELEEAIASHFADDGYAVNDALAAIAVAIGRLNHDVGDLDRDDLSYGIDVVLGQLHRGTIDRPGWCGAVFAFRLGDRLGHDVELSAIQVLEELSELFGWTTTTRPP